MKISKGSSLIVPQHADSSMIVKEQSLVLSKNSMGVVQVKMLDHTLQGVLNGTIEKNTVFTDKNNTYPHCISMTDLQKGIGVSTRNYDRIRLVFADLANTALQIYEKKDFIQMRMFTDIRWLNDQKLFLFGFNKSFLDAASRVGMYAILDADVNRSMGKAASLFLYQLALLYIQEGRTPTFTTEEWCAYTRKDGTPVYYSFLFRDIISPAIREVREKAHIELIPKVFGSGNRTDSMCLEIRPTDKYFKSMPAGVKQLIDLGFMENYAKGLVLHYGNAHVLAAIEYYRKQSRSKSMKGDKIRSPQVYIEQTLENGWVAPVVVAEEVIEPEGVDAEPTEYRDVSGESDQENWWVGLGVAEKADILKSGLERHRESGRFSGRVSDVIAKAQACDFVVSKMPAMQIALCSSIINKAFEERQK